MGTPALLNPLKPFDADVERLNTYFEPWKHRLHDVYQFQQAKQHRDTQSMLYSIAKFISA